MCAFKNGREEMMLGYALNVVKTKEPITVTVNVRTAQLIILVTSDTRDRNHD